LSTTWGQRWREIHFLKSLALAAPADRSAAFYDFVEDMFRVVSSNSGIYNYGYRAKAPGIEAAQQELCRRTAASLPRPGRWLDVGCGVGGPACLLAGENDEVSISGINITPVHIERAKERAASKGLTDRVDFRLGDACAMPFSEGKIFDGVYAIETAFHYADRVAFLREAARVLKPGGRFACADVVSRPEGVRLADRVALPWIHRLLAVSEMYSLAQWRESLAAVGFRSIAVEDISIPTLGMAGEWADQIMAAIPELEERYPRIFLRLMAEIMRQQQKRLHDLPVSYVLVTATLPSDA